MRILRSGIQTFVRTAFHRWNDFSFSYAIRAKLICDDDTRYDALHRRLCTDAFVGGFGSLNGCSMRLCLGRGWILAVPVEHTIECAATKGDFFLLIGKLTGAQPVANDGFVTPH